MKLKKFLVSLTTLAFLLMLGGSNIVNAQFNTQEQAVEPQVSVKGFGFLLLNTMLMVKNRLIFFMNMKGLKVI